MNRGRTAPSAGNSREMYLYVALPVGVYIYDAENHRLLPVAKGDFRTRSGQRSVLTAPLNIFDIADKSRYALEPSQSNRSIGDPEAQKTCGQHERRAKN